MSVPGPPSNGSTSLASVIAAARQALEAHAREINDLNVFPVPDGDTGTNMLQTVQAVERAVEGLAGTSLADRCEAIARAALLGARGNSGMILSQMVRGAADAIADRGLLDGAAVADALHGASDTAYRAVREPVEGTMLTVIRGMAEGTRDLPTGSVEAVLAAALEAGRTSLAATQEMLPQLKEAGVVDSGAYGVLLIVEGLAAGLAGHHVGPAITVNAPSVVPTEHEPSAFRFCTSFVIEDATVELDQLEAQLATLGDSLLVMGDRRQAKIHVHTDEPQQAITMGEAVGIVSGVNVDDMHRQEAARAARIERRARAEHAVATGSLDPTMPLQAATTAIVTDSASDIPKEYLTENMVVVPVPVSFGDEAFLPGVNLDNDTFYERLSAGGEMPTTAAPSMGEFVAVFEEALQRYETVVALHMGRNFSSTVDVARRAALEVDPDRIVVIETGSVSFQLGLLVRRVQAYLERGTTLGAIEDLVDRFRRTQGTVFAVETLEFLRRGGRVGAAKAFIGNLLGLRPVLQIADGEVQPVGRVRGRDRVLPAMCAFVEERTPAEAPVRIITAHARASERMPELEHALRKVRPNAIFDGVAEMGPTVGTHAGPGTIAAVFFLDPVDETR